MRSHLCLACLLLLLPCMAFAQVQSSATVDCTGATPGAFTSLEQAIFNSPDNTVFLVSGTCIENVVNIQNRNHLTFIGNPTATIQTTQPDFAVINITSSIGIEFGSSFVFTGGQGITISNSPSVNLSGITVQNSGTFGITSSNSVVQLSNSSITANTRTGIVIIGGSFTVGGGVTVSNNGRLGISASTAHLSLLSGSSPNIVSQNGIAGIQLVNVSEGDFQGDNEITNNTGGNFGVAVSNSSALVMSGGLINSNTGTGVFCTGTAHCEFGGTHIDGNSAGGLQIIQHSDLALDGTVDISGNTGVGILVDQGSALTSVGGNTIGTNTGDAVVLNTLSALNFTGTDTITATAGNLALNCNNGSMVEGDVSTYKPKKCGTAFQNVPIH